MQIDSIGADTDDIRKVLCPIGSRTGLHPYVSLQDSKLSGDSAAFAHVRRSRQTILSTEQLWTQP
jgi:hypothetical protein